VFATLYEGLGVPLPLPTRVTIGLSKFLGSFWWLILGLIIAGSYSLYRYKKTHQGKRVIDGLMLKIPVIGSVLRKIAVARFCRTLATLISSGVPILDALEITARTSGNAVVEDAIMRRGRRRRRPHDRQAVRTPVFPMVVR
jgi:type IV pilus assembly protein PilC